MAVGARGGARRWAILLGVALVKLVLPSPSPVAFATSASPAAPAVGQCAPIPKYVNGTTCGTRQVLAILLEWPGGSLSATRDRIIDSLFGKDQGDINSFYEQASYGDFRITGPVSPVFDIEKPSSCDEPAFRDTIAAEARSRATHQGYVLSQYETIIYDFPANACLDVGQAPVGGDEVWLPDFLGHPADPFSVYQTTMEISHTLGLAHANGLECKRVTICPAPTGVNDFTCNPEPPPYSCEYANPWDAMGSDLAGWNYRGVGAPPGDGSFDAIELADLGWSAGRTQVVSSTDDGVYQISPIEERRPIHPQALVIRTGDGHEVDVEVRQPVGIDQYLACWPLATAGVQLNMRNVLKDAPYDARQSLLLDTTPASNVPGPKGSAADLSPTCLTPPSGATHSHICTQGIAHSATYCDWFDSTLLAGRQLVTPWFTLILKRPAGANGATVQLGNPVDTVLLDPSLEDFGVMAPGSTSATQTVTLENRTQQTVTVSSVGLGLASGSPFTITHDGCSGQAVSAGGTCSVDVDAEPSPGTPTGSALHDVLTFNDDWNPLPHESARLSVYVSAGVSPTGAWFTEHTPGSEDGGEQPEALACVPEGAGGRCWAVGLRYNGHKPNFGTVYANDGGFVWTRQTVPSDVGQLENVACASTTRCWATGITRDAPPRAAIIATTDGGVTWKRQRPPAGGGIGERISCVSASRCWIATNAVDTVWATSDGGAAWHAQRLPSGKGTGQALDLSFVNANVGTAVGYILGECRSSCGGVVWRTTNGGRTWKIQRKGTGPTPAFAAVSCVDTTHCWAAGESATSGVVFATSNGGSTWRAEQTHSVRDSRLESIGCSGSPPSVRCWATGATQRPVGVILRSTDGGVTWTSQRPPKGVTEVKDVQTVGPLLGWALAPSDETNDWIIATRSGGLAP